MLHQRFKVQTPHLHPSRRKKRLLHKWSLLRDQQRRTWHRLDPKCFFFNSFSVISTECGEYMPKLIHYHDTPTWDKHTIPMSLLKQHHTKQDSWAKLHVLQGQLVFALLNEQGEISSKSQHYAGDEPILIAPNVAHRIVSVSDDVQCQLSFYYAQPYEPQHD